MSNFESQISMSVELFNSLTRVDKVVWNSNDFACVVNPPPTPTSTSTVVTTSTTIAPTTTTTLAPTTTSTIPPTTTSTPPPTTSIVVPTVTVVGTPSPIQGLERGYVEFLITKNSASSINVSCEILNNSINGYHSENVYRKACDEGVFPDSDHTIGKFYPDDNLNGIVRPLYDDFLTNTSVNSGTFRYYFFNPGFNETRDIQLKFTFSYSIGGIPQDGSSIIINSNVNFNSIDNEIIILNGASPGGILEAQITNFAISNNNGIYQDLFTSFQLADRLAIFFSYKETRGRWTTAYAFAISEIDPRTGNRWDIYSPRTGVVTSGPHDTYSFNKGLGGGSGSQRFLNNSILNSPEPILGFIGRINHGTLNGPVGIARLVNEVTVIDYKTIKVKFKIAPFLVSSNNRYFLPDPDWVSQRAAGTTKDGFPVDIFNNNAYINFYEMTFRLHIRKRDSAIDSTSLASYNSTSWVNVPGRPNYADNLEDNGNVNIPIIWGHPD